MKLIEILTVPHKGQRYPTVGDYFVSGNAQFVVVSDMGNEDYEFLVALHELVELWLCKKRGISEESITAFDKQFAAEWPAREDSDNDVPGNDPRAPYRREHVFAGIVERAMAHEMGVDWEEYDKTIEGM